MTKTSAERNAATRALMQYLASEEGRRGLKRNSYASGTPFVAADENESVVAVMSRIESHGGIPAVLAVYFPHRDKNLAIIGIDIGTGSIEDHISTGGDSTIGMLADHISGKRHVTVSVKQNITAQAYDMAFA